jgi:hypothetical protein
MSEEDLELLITLDDPVDAPEEDIFNHLPAEKQITERPLLVPDRGPRE